jgi:hypothetical protein
MLIVPEPPPMGERDPLAHMGMIATSSLIGLSARHIITHCTQL